MTDVEVKSLVSFKRQLICAIDPLYIASHLVENGCISRGLYEVIKTDLSAGIPRTDIADFVINNLPFHTRLVPFIKALDNCGYTKLSSKLYLQFIRFQTGFTDVKKIQCEKRIHLDLFYKSLKSKIHDGQFKNPRHALDQLAKRFMNKFEVELNPKEKQRTAEKCVAVIGAQIVAHAVTFDSTLPGSEMFCEMKSLIPYTENTYATEVVYYVGKAFANLMAMNLEDGENMLTAARVRIYNTGPCLELISVLQIETYFLLWKYEQTPTTKVREDLLMWGRIGLESLEEEQEQIKIFWRRMFILSMVFCLLGIGNRANIIPGADVDDNCIKMAQQLLADFDQYYEGIEQRREMFYQVAKARLNHLLGRKDEALIHISSAEHLAESGQFKEVFYIGQIKSALQSDKSSNNETLLHENDEKFPLNFASEVWEKNVCEPSNKSCENLQNFPGQTKHLVNASKPFEGFNESSGRQIPLLSELEQISGCTCEGEHENNNMFGWVSFSDQSVSSSTQLQEQRMRSLYFTSHVPVTGEKTFSTLKDLHTNVSENVPWALDEAVFHDNKLTDTDETELKQPLSTQRGNIFGTHVDNN